MANFFPDVAAGWPDLDRIDSRFQRHLVSSHVSESQQQSGNAFANHLFGGDDDLERVLVSDRIDIEECEHSTIETRDLGSCCMGTSEFPQSGSSGRFSFAPFDKSESTHRFQGDSQSDCGLLKVRHPC